MLLGRIVHNDNNKISSSFFIERGQGCRSFLVKPKLDVVKYSTYNKDKMVRDRKLTYVGFMSIPLCQGCLYPSSRLSPSLRNFLSMLRHTTRQHLRTWYPHMTFLTGTPLPSNFLTLHLIISTPNFLHLLELTVSTLLSGPVYIFYSTKEYVVNDVVLFESFNYKEDSHRIYCFDDYGCKTLRFH